jgi:hypothetical protein
MQDGIIRRDVLRLGAGSGLAAWLGARQARGDGRTPASACILLYMAGGASHLDTFDPKPGRKTAGDLRAIAGAVDGVQLSEHLPGLAARANHLAIIRSLTSKEGNHDRARHLMHTGYPPQGGVDHPAFGSLVSEVRTHVGLPGYVAIAGPGEDSGFVSALHSPFPVKNPTKPVRYLAHAKGLDDERFARRLGLWRDLERRFGSGRGGAYARSQLEVSEQAVSLMRSPGAAAFDLDSEPVKSREAYGPSEFGQGCLMARRLVEAGVPFVEVTLNGWDTHQDNFPRVKELGAVLDRAMSALIDDLAARGRLASTLVVWLGDFGRTPRINEKGGRDHFPACSSAVLAGGGVRGGQVIGSTDPDGAEVRDRPVTVPDLYRTIASALDLDPNRVRMAPTGRPIKTVDGGQVISGIL